MGCLPGPQVLKPYFYFLSGLKGLLYPVIINCLARKELSILFLRLKRCQKFYFDYFF